MRNNGKEQGGSHLSLALPRGDGLQTRTGAGEGRAAVSPPSIGRPAADKLGEAVEGYFPRGWFPTPQIRKEQALKTLLFAKI